MKYPVGEEKVYFDGSGGEFPNIPTDLEHGKHRINYAYPVVAQNAALVHLPHPPGCPHVPLYNPI